MMVHRIFKDPVLLSALEADFIQYYNIDIYDFFRGDMYIRRLISLIISLPFDSRLVKHHRNDPLSVDEHASINIIEALNLLNFQMYYVAASGIGKEWKNIFKHAPKAGERPKFVEEEKPKKKFMTGRQLTGVIEQTKTRVISHTRSCVKSRINEGGGVIRCDCPSEEPRQK